MACVVDIGVRGIVEVDVVVVVVVVMVMVYRKLG
jgi:hypothetical protein